MSLLLLVGCGSGNFCTVGGRVLVDGEPLSEGGIALRPKTKGSGFRPVRATIADGKFEFVKAQEIVPGTYTVVVTARRKIGLIPPGEEGGPPEDRYQQYLPPQYNTKSTLSAEITGDTDHLLFELELPKKRNKRS